MLDAFFCEVLQNGLLSHFLGLKTPVVLRAPREASVIWSNLENKDKSLCKTLQSGTGFLRSATRRNCNGEREMRSTTEKFEGSSRLSSA